MLIAIEGSVGVGKSTVAKGLAACRKSAVLFESFESNPFLPAFYDDPVSFATETEFTFLLLHFHQLRPHSKAPSKRELITDFHLGKDLLYAELNLKDAKMLRMFKQLYALLTAQVTRPALLVCLSASTKILIDRIRRRKRDFELRVDPAYYSELNTAYERFFNQYDGRKLQISMDEWDFIKTPDLYPKLSLLIDKQLKTR